VAEHEITTRATTAKTTHIDFIHRDFEVRTIVQRHAANQELNITRRWHNRTETIGIPFPSLVYERYRKRIVDRRQRPRKKSRMKTKERDGSGRSKLRSQLEVIDIVSLIVGSRGSFNLVCYLPDGTSRIIGRFTWKTPVKSGNFRATERLNC